MPPLKIVRRLWSWVLLTFEVGKTRRMKHVRHPALSLCSVHTKSRCRLFLQSSTVHGLPNTNGFSYIAPSCDSPCASISLSLGTPGKETSTAHRRSFSYHSLLSSLKVNQTSYNPAPSPSTALAPTSKSKISSDPSAALPHLTIPSPSTPNPPAVCHRLPLSVGRFQIPSSLPNFQTA